MTDTGRDADSVPELSAQCVALIYREYGATTNNSCGAIVKNYDLYSYVYSLFAVTEGFLVFISVRSNNYLFSE